MGQLKMYFLLKMGIFQPAMLVYQGVDTVDTWKSSCFLMRHHCTAAQKEFFGSEICAYPKEPYMSPTKKNAWWELLRLWARFISMPPGSFNRLHFHFTFEITKLSLYHNSWRSFAAWFLVSLFVQPSHFHSRNVQNLKPRSCTWTSCGELWFHETSTGVLGGKHQE